MTVNKAIKDRFKLFEKYSREYIDYFGLFDFSFEIVLDETENRVFKARTNWHNVYHPEVGGDRQFVIEVNSDWLNATADEGMIKKVAFHEVMEALLYKLSDMATNYEYIIPDVEVTSEIHRIIRLFENKVLPLIKI